MLADEQGIRDLDGSAWEVTGMYVGPDIQGKEVHTDWTARIELSSAGLECRVIKWGDRRWSR